MSKLSGVWAASVTPMTSDLLPDAKRLARHMEWLHSEGCHGIVLFGTTGEANSFSVAERRRLLEELFELGADLSNVIVGTGCCSVTDTVELSQHAVDAGCAAVLLLPPFYYKSVSDDGLVAAISASIEKTDRETMKVMLYHFPRMASIGYSVPVIHRLKEAFGSQIAGIKDSTGDTDNLTHLCREIEDFAVFAGSEALLPYVIREGGVGCISATTNVTSRLARAVYDGEKGEAERLIKIRKALEALPFVSTMKHLLADFHDEPGLKTVRPPMTELTAAHQQRLDQILDSTGTLPNFV